MVGAAGSMHGFPAALTSFVGRAAVVDEIAGQLGQYRLVTVTGPGGAGKTRLAGGIRELPSVAAADALAHARARRQLLLVLDKEHQSPSRTLLGSVRRTMARGARVRSPIHGRCAA